MDTVRTLTGRYKAMWTATKARLPAEEGLRMVVEGEKERMGWQRRRRGRAYARRPATSKIIDFPATFHFVYSLSGYHPLITYRA